jgi:hypothetical protein
MTENNGFVPNHKFGLKERHSTVEQRHRIVQRMNGTLENKQ